MSKRDFDCSSSNSSPSDTEGAQAAQDTEDDDDDSNSVESDSEEGLGLLGRRVGRYGQVTVNVYTARKGVCNGGVKNAL